MFTSAAVLHFRTDCSTCRFPCHLPSATISLGQVLDAGGRFTTEAERFSVGMSGLLPRACLWRIACRTSELIAQSHSFRLVFLFISLLIIVFVACCGDWLAVIRSGLLVFMPFTQAMRFALWAVEPQSSCAEPQLPSAADFAWDSPPLTLPAVASPFPTAILSNDRSPTCTPTRSSWVHSPSRWSSSGHRFVSPRTPAVVTQWSACRLCSCRLIGKFIVAGCSFLVWIISDIFISVGTAFGSTLIVLLPSLSPIFRSCVVAICPLFMGMGSFVKISWFAIKPPVNFIEPVTHTFARATGTRLWVAPSPHSAPGSSFSKSTVPSHTVLPSPSVAIPSLGIDVFQAMTLQFTKSHSVRPRTIVAFPCFYRLSPLARRLFWLFGDCSMWIWTSTMFLVAVPCVKVDLASPWYAFISLS